MRTQPPQRDLRRSDPCTSVEIRSIGVQFRPITKSFNQQIPLPLLIRPNLPWGSRRGDAETLRLGDGRADEPDSVVLRRSDPCTSVESVQSVFNSGQSTKSLNHQILSLLIRPAPKGRRGDAETLRLGMAERMRPIRWRFADLIRGYPFNPPNLCSIPSGQSPSHQSLNHPVPLPLLIRLTLRLQNWRDNAQEE